LIIYFAIFGAAFSLILGLVTGVHVVSLLIRVFVSAIAMAAVAVGILFLVKKFIPEKDLNDLLGKESSQESIEEPDIARRVDITDDDTMTAEDITARATIILRRRTTGPNTVSRLRTPEKTTIPNRPRTPCRKNFARLISEMRLKSRYSTWAAREWNRTSRPRLPRTKRKK
jgi:hypothetical protein